MEEWRRGLGSLTSARSMIFHHLPSHGFGVFQRPPACLNDGIRAVLLFKRNFCDNGNVLDLYVLSIIVAPHTGDY